MTQQQQEQRRMGNVCDKMEDGLWLGDKDVYGAYADGREAEYKRFQAIVSALHPDEVARWRIREKVAAANIAWLYVPIDDSAEADISQHFQQVIAFVEAARDRGDHVLIHCAAGVSRSATLMIAYLMWKRTWTRKQAVEYVVARRKVVDPNDGFMDQLATFERVLSTLALQRLNGKKAESIGDNETPVHDQVNAKENRNYV